MCSQIFPFVRAKTQAGLSHQQKTHRQTRKKNSKTKKQNFFEIFHEMSKTCNSQSLQKEHSLSLSLSLSLHHHRERRRRKSFTTQIFDDDEWW